MSRYRCSLCGQVFKLPTGRPHLPVHRYTKGTLKGQPCASVYGDLLGPA
jgi:rubredoxin